ncbi:restriction endonuclease subunit S [Gillisia sp. JM1]|uniref:restriction endonuclease subunit S n=1 Tax=Gillisia sp. JM1 TaxID=1283286 RepID=UPI00041E4586|nr:restriction endonuclease subunit S [Gillisia sp. JM1]
MRKDWKEIEMVDACEVLTCGVASTPKYVDESVGVPFLSAQNVKNGEVVLHKYNYISQAFHEHLTKKNKPRKGDILYSRVGAKYGEAGVVEHDFEFSVYVSVTLMRPKAELFDIYYFKYYLNSPRIKNLAKKSIQSSGVPNLNVKVVRGFPIPIPPLAEQKQIVEILDEAFAAIDQAKANIEKNIQNAKELFQSKLSDIFSQKGAGWEEKTLGEVCNLIKRGIAPKYIEEVGLVVINQKCIRDHKINLERARNHNLILKAVNPERLIKLGDVLVNSTGTGTLGRVAQVREKAHEGCTVDTHVTIVRPIEGLFFNEFFGYALIKIEKQITEGGDGASGQTELSRLKLEKEFKICFPTDHKLQKQYVNQLDSLKVKSLKIQDQYLRKLENLEELKKVILQKAFSGELTYKMAEV